MRSGNVVMAACALALACGEVEQDEALTREPLTAAAYDPALRAPACRAQGPDCDSGTLLVGRGPLGPEQGAPNTLGAACADGAAGGFHADESLDGLRVATVDGSPLAPGKQVRIEATVWAYAAYGSDHLDLYHAPDASAPAWTFLATLTPSAAGRQVLTATFTLPEGTLQAIRGNFRYTGSAGPCTTGAYDDRDDLAFATGEATPDAAPPQVSLTAPLDGETVSGWLSLAADASDDRGVTRVEFLVDGAVVAEATAPPYATMWWAGGAFPLGPHTVSARATDLAGNATDSVPALVLVVDREPPGVTIVDPPESWHVGGVRTVIVSAQDASGVTSVELLADGALVGAAPAAPAEFAWDTTALADGPHTLVARAVDGFGNVGASAPVQEIVDNTPAEVAIFSPPPGAGVGATLTASATATDAIGPLIVRFYLDDRLLGVFTSPPYAGSWSTVGLLPGMHTLAVEAGDLVNVGRSTIEVELLPDVVPPEVALVEPAPAARPGASLRLLAEAADAYGVARVEFLGDGVLLGTATSPPYQRYSTAPATGTRTFVARAYDLAGNSAESAPVVVTADGVAPSVSLAAPAPGAALSGEITLGADASDDVALARVEFWAGRFLLAVADAPPWNVRWNTGDLSNGSWSVVAKAYDVAGNVAASPPAAVTISNATTAAYVYGTYALRCGSAGRECSSGSALDGRGPLGPEEVAPGTILNACQDGTAGAYHLSPSIDRIRVRAVADAFLGPARPVDVEVAAWISDLGARVDLYVTTNPSQPVWTFVKTLAPSAVGAQVLATQLTLPDVQGYHALRASLRSAATPAAPCTTGASDDHDDLVFRVSRDPVPPTAALTSPAAGAKVSGSVPLACAASDDVAVASVVFKAGTSGIATDLSAPWAAAWDTTAFPNGAYTLTCTAADSNGNVTVSAPVEVVVSNDQTQLLANGGFEAGHAAWTESPYGVVDGGTGTPARTGSWKARLRGKGVSGTDTLSQVIAIPSTATTATLRFWLMVQTAEGTSYPYDRLVVTARSATTGALLATLATFSNQHKSSAYVERTVDLQAYRGQTVRLQLDASEDSIYQTTFLVDDATLVVASP